MKKRVITTCMVQYINNKNNLCMYPKTLKCFSPVCLSSADEELRPIGARTSVGHAQSTINLVFQLKVFIFKLVAVNGLATSSIATSEVATLSHTKDKERVGEMVRIDEEHEW